MRLSRESLDLLLTPEYREYKGLKAKNFDGDGLGCFFIIILHLALIGLLGLVLRLNKRDDWAALYAAGVLIPYCWAPVIWLVLGLGIDDWFKKVYRSRSEKSDKFQRLKHFQQFFPDAERLVNEQVQEYCRSGVRRLVSELRKALRGTTDYQTAIDALEWNHRFLADSQKARNGNYLDLRTYVSFLEEADVHFEQDLGIHAPKKSDFGSKTTANKFYKRKQTYSGHGNILGINDPISPSTTDISNHQRTQQSDRSVRPTRQENSSTAIPQHDVPTAPPTTQVQPVVERKLENTAFPGEPVIVLPPRSSGSPRLFHAPPDYYVELADRRTEIGRKGEKFVMELERSRILNDLGSSYLKRLIHKALEADGFGYDIESIENNRKIYIEVKTTVGSKRAGIVFTHTEFSAMEKKKSAYYLYRVFNFDTESGKGDFKVYRGRDEILANFDISYQNYVLTHK